MPSGVSTAWSAIWRAPCRYLFSSAGDMVSVSPELSKPAVLAGSTGNWRAGQVADGVVVFCVAQTARQHDAGIAAEPLDLLGTHVMHEGDDLLDRLLRWLRARLGRHLMIGQPVGQQRPAREILLHLVHRSIGLEIELAGGLRA